MTTQPNDPYWYRGAELTPGELNTHHVYIYHLPKTGTTTLYSSLRVAYTLQFNILSQQIPSFQPPQTVRIDNTIPVNARIQGNYGLVASHNPFGFHKSFADPSLNFKLITVLRAPNARVLSAYTYDCMRNDRVPTESEYQDAYRKEENRNKMVKQLAGISLDQTADESHLTTAISNLTSHFFMYGTTNHIKTIITTILQMNKMPNVLTERLNKTEDKYLLEGTPFEDEVREINKLDHSLFDFVKGNPRVEVPAHLVPESKPHQYTMLIKQAENGTNGAVSTEKPVPTGTVIGDVEHDRYPKDKFDALFDS